MKRDDSHPGAERLPQEISFRSIFEDFQHSWVVTPGWWWWCWSGAPRKGEGLHLIRAFPSLPLYFCVILFECTEHAGQTNKCIFFFFFPCWYSHWLHSCWKGRSRSKVGVFSVYTLGKRALPICSWLRICLWSTDGNGGNSILPSAGVWQELSTL